MYLALDDAELARLLADDVPFEDITTRALAIGSLAARLEFRARRAMTVCGGEEAARLFTLVGCKATLLVPSAGRVEEGACLLQASGSATCLHRAWKTAQVLMETLSGIASAAAALVAAAEPLPVACTRKTLPGTKALCLKAVRAGGATVHRLGLSDSVLVFPEHRLFLVEPPERTIARLRRAEPERKLVVEVVSATEALAWAMAGADVLQLEKFTPEAVAEVRAQIDPAREPRLAGRLPLLAVAGGVRADNAAAYAAAGADLLVSSAPFSAPPADVQVDFSLT
jgi:molybdenum transport protein